MTQIDCKHEHTEVEEDGEKYLWCVDCNTDVTTDDFHDEADETGASYTGFGGR